MLSRSVLRRISATWTPISLQSRKWLAEMSQNVRITSAARTYFRDINLSETVEDVDDALELVYFMQRFGYPPETKLELAVKRRLAEDCPSIRFSHLVDVARYILEDTERRSAGKGLREHWARILLGEAWFVNRAATLVDESSEGIANYILLARAMSAVQQGPSALNSALLNAVQKAITAAPLSFKELANVVEFIMPLRASPKFSAAVLTQFAAVEVKSRLTLLAAAIRTNPTDAAFHEKCFASIVTDKAATKDVATALHCCHYLWSLAASFSKASLDSFTDSCIHNVLRDPLPQAEDDVPVIAMVCEVIQPRSSPEMTKLVEKWLVEIGNSPTSDISAVASAFRGLAIIQRPKSAGEVQRKILGHSQWKVASQTPDPETAKSVVQGMAATGLTDAQLFDPCFRAFLQEPNDFLVRDVAFFIFVASQLTEPYPASVFDRFAARVASSVQFQKAEGGEPPLSPQQLALLLKGFAFAKYPIASNAKLIEFINGSIELCANLFSITECLSLIAVVHDLKLSTLDRTMELLLMHVAESLSVAGATEAREVAGMLARIGMRNVALLNAAGERLRATNASFANLASFCTSLRALKMQHALRKLDLASLIPEFQLNDEHILLWFSSNCPFPNVSVSDADIAKLKTSSCMMLAGMLQDPRAVLDAVCRRGACELLDTDILLRAMLATKKGPQLVELIRVGECAIGEFSALEISRVFQHASSLVKLPLAFFRQLGKKTSEMAETMTAEQAVACLRLYAEHVVRDDRVLKALFTRMVKMQRVILPSAQLKEDAEYCVMRLGAHWAPDLLAAVKKEK